MITTCIKLSSYRAEKVAFLIRTELPLPLGEVILTYFESHKKFILCPQRGCRSQWQRGITRGSAAARLLGLWVRKPTGTLISVS